MLAFLILGLCLRADPAANPRFTGAPFLRVWTPDDYSAHPQNHCVVQHPVSGFIYIGNAAGVLEFDGMHWQLIPGPERLAVQALAIDRHGRIWGCGGTQLFRLERDAHGAWQAVSQWDRVPAEHRPLMTVTRCVATSEGVWFRDRRGLIFFGDDAAPARVLPLTSGDAAVLRLWLIGDEPHVTVSGGAAYRVRGGELQRLPGLRNSMWAARPIAPDLWQGAAANDVVRWDGTNFSSQAGPISSEGAQAATFLADGRIVFGTVREGIVICDPEGRRLQRIDRSLGLPANLITGVAEDREGGLWATFHFGVARLQLDSPFARHGPAHGLEGTVVSLVSHRDRLYAGGSEGLAQRGPTGRFQAIPGIPGPDRQTVVHDDWIFSLSFRLRGFQPGRATAAGQLENRNYFGLVPLPAHPGRYAHGANDGLRWAGFAADKWTSHGPVAGPREHTSVLAAAPANVVWAVNQGRLWRFDFGRELHARVSGTSFGPAEGLPSPPSALFLLGTDPVAIVDGQLLRFDAPAGRFVPETRISGLSATPIRHGLPDSDGTCWLLAGNETLHVIRAQPSGPDRWQAERLPGTLHRLQTTTLFAEAATNTLWIGAHGSLISRDLAWRPTRPIAPPVARIRRVLSAPEKEIRALPPLLPGAAHDPLTLPAENRHLRFALSAASYVPDHHGSTHLEFRTRLVGFESDWGPWTRQPSREFTNLPWRRFSFEVQARDADGNEGPVERLAFRVVTPWWASLWALGAYGVFGLAGVFGLVRFRTRLLRQRNARLEAIVATRTRELATEKALLAANAEELARVGGIERDEKIAAQLREEKARLEVLRYQLNPHFLYNSLNSIYGLLYESPAAAARMVLRLSDFCRATLTTDTDTNPSLGAQCEALRNYLEVEKVRWGDSLQVTFDVADAAAAVPLPPFLLLPLLENAVKYGGMTSSGTLGVRLSAQLTSAPALPAATPADRPPSAPPHPRSVLRIEVANTGTWVEPSTRRADSSRIGLENLRLRLERTFPAAHEFRIGADEGWVVARLTLHLPEPGPATSAATASPATSP